MLDSGMNWLATVGAVRTISSTRSSTGATMAAAGQPLGAARCVSAWRLTHVRGADSWRSSSPTTNWRIGQETQTPTWRNYTDAIPRCFKIDCMLRARSRDVFGSFLPRAYQVVRGFLNLIPSALVPVTCQTTCMIVAPGDLRLTWFCYAGHITNCLGTYYVVDARCQQDAVVGRKAAQGGWGIMVFPSLVLDVFRFTLGRAEITKGPRSILHG
jgi:hypothetical protein